MARKSKADQTVPPVDGSAAVQPQTPATVVTPQVTPPAAPEAAPVAPEKPERSPKAKTSERLRDGTLIETF